MSQNQRNQLVAGLTQRNNRDLKKQIKDEWEPPMILLSPDEDLEIDCSNYDLYDN